MCSLGVKNLGQCQAAPNIGDKQPFTSNLLDMGTYLAGVTKANGYKELCSPLVMAASALAPGWLVDAPVSTHILASSVLVQVTLKPVKRLGYPSMLYILAGCTVPSGDQTQYLYEWKLVISNSNTHKKNCVRLTGGNRQTHYFYSDSLDKVPV